MRLINTNTLQFQEFIGETLPRYAILSHRWRTGVGEEANLQDFLAFQRSVDVERLRGLGATVFSEHSGQNVPPGIMKVVDFCRKASDDGHEWGWVDTVCIDRTNLVELSEAINSMYRWYQGTDMCYVYLQDCDYKSSGQLARSDWFQRGWTLQELIAPRHMTFLGPEWAPFGTKQTLKHAISRITGVPEDLLKEPGTLRSYSSAQRISWAASRETLRPEDVAYCLLGLCQVNMGLLYGEGAKKAFRRLQLQILSEHDDESLLMWGPGGNDKTVLGQLYTWNPQHGWRSFGSCCKLTGVLATSPHQFSLVADVYVTGAWDQNPIRDSNRGLEIGRRVYFLKHVTMEPMAQRLRSSDVDVGIRRVILLPLACSADGSSEHSFIILAEDPYSRPTKRWCRVIVPRHDIERFVAMLKKVESEKSWERLFARISWPEDDHVNSNNAQDAAVGVLGDDVRATSGSVQSQSSKVPLPRDPGYGEK